MVNIPQLCARDTPTYMAVMNNVYPTYTHELQQENVKQVIYNSTFSM